MSYLVETTFNELALLADEMELNDKVIFSTEDPEESLSCPLIELGLIRKSANSF